MIIFQGLRSGIVLRYFAASILILFQSIVLKMQMKSEQDLKNNYAIELLRHAMTESTEKVEHTRFLKTKLLAKIANKQPSQQ